MKFIFSVLFTSLIFLGCSEAQQPSQQKSENPVITASISEDYQPTAFAQAMKGKDVLLLDVRTPGEYADGHLSGSVNIDWNSPGFSDAVKKLDKTKPVYVYCAVGGRSSQAKKTMASMGFKEIHNMLGGYDSWSGQGLPVEK
jgi:rhodanese-related sulfurtransferase